MQIGVRMKWLLLLLMHLNEMLIVIQVVIVVQSAIGTQSRVELVLSARLISKMMDSIHVRHQSAAWIVCFLVFSMKCGLIWLIHARAIARFVRIVIVLACCEHGIVAIAEIFSVRRHALLFLTTIAKPNANHLFFQLKQISQVGNLLRCGLGIALEMCFQSAFYCLLDACALLAFASLCSYFVHVGGRAIGRVGLFKPLGQQRLQLAHVFKTQLQRFETANCRLTEHVAIQSAQCQTDIGLRKAQLDTTLLELFGKVLQVVCAH